LIGVARQLLEAIIGNLAAKVIAGHVLDFVGLVENYRGIFRKDAAEVVLLQRKVSEKQMMINDDEVGFLGALVHGGHEALVEVVALLPGAGVSAGIEAAHERGALVRGHIANRAAIHMALDAGIDVIDHGDGLDDAAIERMAELGTFLVPSQLFPARFSEMMGGGGLGFTAGMAADIEQALGDAFAGVIPNNYRLVREAIDRGVPLDEVKSGNAVSSALRKIILPGGAVERVMDLENALGEQKEPAEEEDEIAT